MNYAGFNSALSNLRRGPSTGELAMWLGAGAISGVADTMERRRLQARDDARYAQELALRQKYQDAQIAAMQGNQAREDAQFKADYGTTENTLTAPLPTTTLPDPTTGGAASWLTPPSTTQPFDQPKLGGDYKPTPAMVPKVIPGFKAREFAIRENAQRSALATADLERQKAQAEMDDSLDPKMKALRIAGIQAQIDAHRASAASAYASATESKARAGLYSAKTDALTDPETASAASYAKKFGLSEGVYRQYLKDFKKELAGPVPDAYSNPQGYEAWRSAMQQPADMRAFLPWLSTKTGKSVVPGSSQASTSEQAGPPLLSGDRQSARTFRNNKTGRDEQFRLSEDGTSWVKIGP